MKLGICTWQVFWLNPNLMAFPLKKQWQLNQVNLPGYDTRGSYSYGDSAGFRPASLFIPVFDSREPNTGANVKGNVMLAVNAFAISLES